MWLPANITEKSEWVISPQIWTWRFIVYIYSCVPTFTEESSLCKLYSLKEKPETNGSRAVTLFWNENPGKGSEG